MTEQKKELKIYITAHVEQEFRKHAMEKYGYGKGSLSMAVEDALSHWNQHFFVPTMTLEELGGDPVRAIRGLLKGKTNKTAVELQHDIGRILRQKYEQKRKKER